MRKFVIAVASAALLAPLVPAAADDMPAAPSISAGYGKLTVGGLAQIWADAATHPNDFGAAGDAKVGASGFRVRRMEVHLDGSVDPRLSYHLNVDFARNVPSNAATANGILQDVYLDYGLGRPGDIFFGQTKIPLGLEGLMSSAHLPTIERPLFIVGPRQKSSQVYVPQYGDVRDIGVQYRVTQPMYTAQIAITEGAGDYQNVAGSLKNGKQVTAQFFVRPWGMNGVQLGATGSGGPGYYDTLAAGSPYLPRNRGGGSILYAPGKWLLQAEYMAGGDGIAAAAVSSPAVSVTSTTYARHGEYGLIGYDLGGYKSGNGNQAVAQYDYWDPNPASGFSRQSNVTLGLNHDMDNGHRRLQLNYVHEHFDQSALVAGKVSDNDEFILAAGVNW